LRVPDVIEQCEYMKTMMIWFAVILGVLAGALLVVGVIYSQHPKFGQLPAGQYLKQAQASPQYHDGEFHNQTDTPLFTTDQGFVSVLLENMTQRPDNLTPAQALPSQAVDFHALDRSQDLVIWLGHSSFYVQLAGQRILIDPVFSDSAAPVSFANKAYPGTSRYSAEDFPWIDLLLITHDHWDHLDYPSMMTLRGQTGKVVVPQGVGSYLRGWRFDPDIIQEGEWYDQFEITEHLKVHLIPARHYSGRLLKRRQTLWAGFILETRNHRLLFSGDTGFGPHFAEIAERFDSFDLVALDSGQYDPRWANIHMNPEQASEAAEILGAKALLPAHVGRFTLARHAWDEPFRRLHDIREHRRYQLLTPVIGQVLVLDGLGQQTFTEWWQ